VKEGVWIGWRSARRRGCPDASWVSEALDGDGQG
jgi:hypothetical protein